MMTCEEILKALRDGKTVACDDKFCMRIAGNYLVQIGQINGEIVDESSGIFIPIDDVLKNETGCRIIYDPILNDGGKTK